MTFRFSRLSPLVVFLTAVLPLTTALFAQEGARGSQHPGVGLRKARQEVSDKQRGEESKGGKWATLTPEERLNASVRRNSKGQCRFVATCRPPKLMPGESGTLLITAILQGAAVLPAPLQMTMIARNPRGSVALGAMVANPAQLGVLAKGYLGRPVYENTAVLRVPVTMGTDAKLGSKQPVALDLQFDIFDGTSAQVVGRFIERVTTKIEVGQYIDPPVAGRSAPQPTEPNPVISTPTEPKGATNDTNQPKGPDAMGGTPAVVPVGNNVSTNNNEVTEPTGGGDLPPTETDEGGLPLGMIIGGGAFLLVILLLMMRKK